MEAQKVLVIQDASRDVSWSAVRWILHGLSLKAGDELVLLQVLHKVINPMGYMIKVDSNSINGANPKIVEEEVARKKEEYRNNEMMEQLFEQCQMKKIHCRIVLHAGPSTRVVALEFAKSLRATWVILDRQLKKDKKYFLEKLSCGISRMKHNNTIEELRGPKGTENTKMRLGKSTTGHVTYDEMIPGKRKNKLSSTKASTTQNITIDKEQEGDGGGGPPWDNIQELFSLSKSSSGEQIFSRTTSSSSPGWLTDASSSIFSDLRSTPLGNQDEETTTTNTEQETSGEQSPFYKTESRDRCQIEAYCTGSPDEQQKQHTIDGDGMEFENSICRVCNNRRPRIELRKDFTYAELHAATDGFSSKNFLSEGGFGSVYQGQLKNRLRVAVKQHKVASLQGEKEFKTEVHVLSKARHENLVMLLGSCSEGNHRLLVYEYVCNGSLDQHLSRHARRPLSWDERIKIALGAARGLEYLHKNNIIHRDMRPSNILITHDHEALLGDFGLARTQYEDPELSTENRVVGTLGYLAPEYAESGKVSTKTDVYSFGVVLLQLITGYTTTDKILGGRSLVGWARPLLKEKNYPDLIDKRIIDSHDVHQLLWMVRVAERCLTKDPNKRENMAWVLNYLDYISQANAGCSVGDFSPLQSDSLNSLAESPGSEDDNGTNRQENFTTELSSINRKNQTSTSDSPSHGTHTIHARISNAPAVSGAPSSGSGGGRAYERKRGTPTSSYNEMVI